MGKTFLASALGHAACRAGRTVLFLRADRMFRAFRQSRADHSTEKLMRRLLAPDLLILDDFGLRRLTAEQSSDLYELILERHRRASTILTTNLAFKDWPTIFPNASCVTALIDRLTHHADICLIEGQSYRRREAEARRPKKNRE